MKFSWNHNFKVPRDQHLQVYYFVRDFIARPDFQLKLWQLGKLIFCDNSVLKSISRLTRWRCCDREQIRAINIKNKLFIIFIRRGIRLWRVFLRLVVIIIVCIRKLGIIWENGNVNDSNRINVVSDKNISGGSRERKGFVTSSLITAVTALLTSPTFWPNFIASPTKEFNEKDTRSTS